MDVKEIKVGIADMNIAVSPDKIMTIGLGSCIGIALYDSRVKLGGLAHIMLPDSNQFNNINNPLKFADLAIPLLIKDMEKRGSNKSNLTAKIVGGASMFTFTDSKMNMDIGNRNSIAVRAVLRTLSIPLLREEVGGNKGRTMIFDTCTGVVQIRTIGISIIEI